MKLKTSIILCSLITATSAPAIANPVWDLYAGVFVGAGGQTVFIDDKDETNSAQSFGAMFGLDLPVFRIEAEYNYINESDSHANLAMLNAYFKMTSTVVKPYFGLGVGAMFNGENDKTHIDLDTSAAYQGMLGVTFSVPALPFKFDVEGRALYIPDIAKVGDDKPDLLHYDARIKIRYVF
ncbi:MAG: hypothetical protein J5742_01365 [Alphaproteobacteria bacterium]|nr:hypothetical protein [Alphaproteobacteria bacterium]